VSVCARKTTHRVAPETTIASKDGKSPSDLYCVGATSNPIKEKKMFGCLTGFFLLLTFT
jgi:hypothetical protein